MEQDIYCWKIITDILDNHTNPNQEKGIQMHFVNTECDYFVTLTLQSTLENNQEYCGNNNGGGVGYEDTDSDQESQSSEKDSDNSSDDPEKQKGKTSQTYN